MKLNFNHLYYFWSVVRLGGVTQAAEELHLTPQTVSGQLKLLQEQFPEPLLLRSGRRLMLSPLGERVFEHADAMFANTEALLALSDRAAAGFRRRVRIGVADVLPKISVRRLLQPLLGARPPPRLSVREVDLAGLLEDLAHRRLDAVIADRPMTHAAHAAVSCRLLLSSPLAIYAAEPLAGRLAEGFPGSLDGAPALLPTALSFSRRSLDEWFHRHGLRPEVVGEMEDSALVKSFGQAGFGFFAAPADQADDIAQQYRARRIGLLDGVEERVYAVTLSDGPLNPAVRDWLEGWPGPV